MDDSLLLTQMETDFAALKNQYDLFFQGGRRGEPIRDRKEFEGRLLAFSRRAMSNNAEQFRLNNLQGKFWSSVNLWARIVRDFEEGRLRRDKTGALTRIGINPSPEAEDGPAEPNPPETGAAAPPSAAGMELFDRTAKELLEARKQCGMKADPSELASLRIALQSRAKEISTSAGGKHVEFLVTVEDGKPKIKARLS